MMESRNFIGICAAAAFYFVEKDINPHVHNFFDAIWWAAVTITTVGYGDVTPHTIHGKIIAILLMMSGTTMFMGFIALFSSFFIRLEIKELEAEVDSLRKGIRELTR